MHECEKKTENRILTLLRYSRTLRNTSARAPRCRSITLGARLGVLERRQHSIARGSQGRFGLGFKLQRGVGDECSPLALRSARRGRCMRGRRRTCPRRRGGNTPRAPPRLRVCVARRRHRRGATTTCDACVAGGSCLCSTGGAGSGGGRGAGIGSGALGCGGCSADSILGGGDGCVGVGASVGNGGVLVGGEGEAKGGGQQRRAVCVVVGRALVAPGAVAGAVAGAKCHLNEPMGVRAGGGRGRPLYADVVVAFNSSVWRNGNTLQICAHITCINRQHCHCPSRFTVQVALWPKLCAIAFVKCLLDLWYTAG